MRRLLPLLFLTTACAAIERPDDLTPGPHLLLAGTGSIGAPMGGPTAAPDDAEPMEEVEAYEEAEPFESTPERIDRPPPREAVVRETERGPAPPSHPVSTRLKALEGKKQIDGRPADDTSLVRAAFKGVPGIAPVDDLISLRSRSVPRRQGGIKEGDLIFFGGDAREVPAVAVVYRRVGRGTVEAAAVTRGAVRFIRVTPMYPHARRRKGQIANSFLRTVRAGDPRDTAYLSGQLLEDVRVLVR